MLSLTRNPLVRNRARQVKEIIYSFTRWRHLNGHNIYLPKPIASQLRPFTNHLYEKEAYNSINKYVKNGYMCVDIGANVGVMSYFMSKKTGSNGYVYSYEPSPIAYRQLLDMIYDNALKNVFPTQSVIAEKCCACDFYVSSRDPLSVMSSLRQNDPKSIKHKLPQLTLDELFGIDRKVDYIKIDAEGAEVNILKGSLKTLEKWKPILQVEVHGPFLKDFGTSIEELFSMMKHIGYNIINSATDEETNFDDFKKDSKVYSLNPIDKTNMGYEGYGHLTFIP